MKLRINDSILVLEFDNRIEETTVRNYFIYEDMSKAITRSGFDPKKVKKVRFLKKGKTGKFFMLRSGFLFELLVIAKKENLNVEFLDDSRTKFKHQSKKYKTEDLKKYFPFEYVDHQTEALQKMLKATNAIIKAVTSAGKTEIFRAYIQETKLPTLILVNRVSLCIQIAQRIQKDIPDIDVGIWHGKTKKRGKDITVATIGSVKSLQKIDDYKVLIIDELHNAASNNFQEFLEYNEFPIKIGMSATPDKGEKLGFAKIRQFFGPIVYDIDARPLIKHGVIAKPKIYFLPNECRNLMDWQVSFEYEIVKNKERNQMISKIAKHYKKNVLVLINDIKHKQGEIIKEEIEKEVTGEVVFIHGSSTLDRQKVINDFDAGNIDVLIATNIFNEGISIDNIKTLVIASGRKSKSETLQKIGRGARTTKDKKTFEVYDFQDIGNKFLEKHAKQRKGLYKQEGFEDVVEGFPEWW